MSGFRFKYKNLICLWKCCEKKSTKEINCFVPFELMQNYKVKSTCNIRITTSLYESPLAVPKLSHLRARWRLAFCRLAHHFKHVHAQLFLVALMHRHSIQVDKSKIKGHLCKFAWFQHKKRKFVAFNETSVLSKYFFVAFFDSQQRMK